MSLPYLKRIFLAVLVFLSVQLFAQNEFYIKGDSTYTPGFSEVYINGCDSLNPTLFIKGELVNKNGQLFSDSGVLELTGDFTNDVDGVTGMYESSGVERFSGSTNSFILGKLDGDSALINQFYDFKLDKDSSNLFVYLVSDLHINKEGTLEFEGDGVISTDSSANSGNGEDFGQILYIQNDESAAIVGASTGNGATNKYVAGKLKRQVSGTNSYYFPIGVSPDYLDGMESFDISFTSNDSLNTGLLGYVKDEGSTALASTITTYADLGTHPGGAATGLDFSFDPFDCVSGDGVIDKVDLSVGQSHAWVISPDVDNGTYLYDVQFYPGAVLSASASFYTCGSLELKYMMKDDVPGGDGTPTGNGWPTFLTTGYLTAPNGSDGLSNQSSFSTFKNGGAELNGTTLPVELIGLTAYGVDNSHIHVDWVTATEINNEGFEIQRSTNGIDFETIGWESGHGTTSTTQNYRYIDEEVSKGVLYYYRLKQIDFDGQFEFTLIVSASLQKEGGFTVNVFPNPSKVREELVLSIESAFTSSAELKVYDVLGKLVINEELELSEGTNNYRLDNSAFAAGQYFVVVNLNLDQVTKNVIVVD